MVFVETFVHIFYVVKSTLFDLVQSSKYSGLSNVGISRVILHIDCQH